MNRLQWNTGKDKPHVHSITYVYCTPCFRICHGKMMPQSWCRDCGEEFSWMRFPKRWSDKRVEKYHKEHTADTDLMYEVDE